MIRLEELTGAVRPALKGVVRRVRMALEPEAERREAARVRALERARGARFRARNRERVRAAKERWRKANPDLVRAARARWKAKNRERLRAGWRARAKRVYWADHEAGLARVRAGRARRRARVEASKRLLT